MGNLDLWSEVEQKIASFKVSLEDDIAVPQPLVVDLPKPQVIVARYGDEFYKFSPNTTDEELQQQIAKIIKEKS